VKFRDYSNADEPALEIFNLCLKTVFDEDDGNTEHLDRIGPEARLVYLLWCFDGEVHNGGFEQLFFNSLGDYCFEILEGLHKIGAQVSAQLLEQAMAWFPGSKPSSDRGERWQQLESFKEDENYEAQQGELDDEFYKYEDNLAELLHKYVRENPGVSINA